MLIILSSILNASSVSLGFSYNILSPLLTKWHLCFHFLRDISETRITTVSCILAFRKLDILHNNIRCVNLHTILVGIAAGLNASFHNELHTLMTKLLQELCCLVFLPSNMYLVCKKADCKK